MTNFNQREYHEHLIALAESAIHVADNSGDPRDQIDAAWVVRDVMPLVLNPAYRIPQRLATFAEGFAS